MMNNLNLRIFYSTLLLCVCAAAMGCTMNNDTNDADFTRSHFENREFRISRPNDQTKAVLVFLHGASATPLEDTKVHGVLQEYAAQKGYLLVRPQGSISCAKLGIRNATPKVCWDLRDIQAEVSYIERLLEHVKGGHRSRFSEVIMLGYSNGGF